MTKYSKYEYKYNKYVITYALKYAHAGSEAVPGSRGAAVEA